MFILTLKEGGLTALNAAVTAVIMDEHQLYCQTFAKKNVDCQWKRVMFSDDLAS
jgi:hypothetical protein